jgi:hypothetical protein
MNGWRLASFSFGKTVRQRSISLNEPLNNYGGEVPAFFEDLDLSGPLTDSSVYFAAPDAFLRSQINSYGGKMTYTITHSGYEFQGRNE